MAPREKFLEKTYGPSLRREKFTLSNVVSSQGFQRLHEYDAFPRM